MDPITQGALGAVLPQSFAKKALVSRAGLFGFLAGITADLDVIIRSSEDPLLFLEFHRQFTHSLVFIPIGGALCAIIFYFLLGKKMALTKLQTYFFCTLGYATHSILDSCTSYGTQLFWPLSNARIAWDLVPIIDPIITLPLLLGTIMAAKWQKPLFSQIAIVWSILYIFFSVFQREAAITAGKLLAAQRGHEIHRIEAKPSFGNTIVWKTIYETEDYFFIDAFHIGFSQEVFEGTSILKLNIQKDFPWLDPNSQQAVDIERFRWFSNDFIAKDPIFPNRIFDVRYSMLPNEINSLWSIEVARNVKNDKHVQFHTNRSKIFERAKKLWSMIILP